MVAEDSSRREAPGLKLSHIPQQVTPSENAISVVMGEPTTDQVTPTDNAISLHMGEPAHAQVTPTGNAISLHNMGEPNIAINGKARTDSDILYGITDNPPWSLSLFLGFQHFLTSCGSTVSIPLLLAGPLCMTYDNVGIGEVIATTFFMSGITTLLQTGLGVRLPVVQGASSAFLAPTAAILSLPRWACPQDLASETSGLNNTGDAFINQTTLLDTRMIWQLRMREIQGAICIASLFQIVIGLSGAMSFVLRYIGPLTITPTVTLIGLSLFELAAQKSASQWWIAFTTVFLITLFCQGLKSVTVPVPTCSGMRRCSRMRMPVFKLFPILLAMVFSWLLCYILTVTDVLPSTKGSWGYNARTDIRSSIFQDSKWIRVPYPAQWGLPTVSASAVFGMLAGVLASIMESIGDYYACARLSGAPPPPPSAVNRGIAMEGIGCLLVGLFGTGNGTTSYSQNVGAIGTTKVGSRRVVMVTGCLLIVMGCVGKVGALFATIPDPVVGGMFIAMFGMITAVGLSNLQFVDLKSSRNLFVIALSLFIGISFPNWMSKNRNVINTGNESIDQILTVMCSTSMFIGGLVGFVLDLALPGTLEERGMIKWREDSGATLTKMTVQHAHSEQLQSNNSIYDFPGIFKILNRLPLSRFIPVCPASDSTRKGASLTKQEDYLQNPEISFN
ncbi:solute carrier family 23 member 1 [Plakobranchus ocellatus]|uniref:Solute carrier family 23 member 1 n=1 Tax=Plakobranchus ocellatus TaxID=259542 RepID=A0AAV4CQW2_9GAST|nr:solute carrier family 23 member 1 [Plakobranchus ocellatus]